MIFKKGDEVFLVSNNRSLTEITQKEEIAKIENIGHIYYTLDNGLKIDKKTLNVKRKVYSVYYHKMYKNKEEYLNLKIGNEMFENLVKTRNNNFTKEQMVEVYKILGLEKELK